MIETNLLPKQLKEEFKMHKKAQRSLIFSALFITCLLILTGVVWNFENSTDREASDLANEVQNAKLASSNKELTVKREELEKLEVLVEDLEKVQADQNHIGPFILEVFQTVPEGIKVDTFMFDLVERKVSIIGVASSREALLQLTEDLGELESIANVDNPLSNLVQQTDINFEIEATVSAPSLKKKPE